MNHFSQVFQYLPLKFLFLEIYFIVFAVTKSDIVIIELFLQHYLSIKKFGLLETGLKIEKSSL